MSRTAKAGCLIVLDSHGRCWETISGHGINGPWDMTALGAGPFAELFVTNVLNGTVAAKGAVVHRGTVLRLPLRFRPGHAAQAAGHDQVGSGFAERTDPAALVVGPTGRRAWAVHGTLYVADTGREPDHRDPACAESRSTSAGTGRGDQERRPVHPAGPGHRAERRRAHRQRRNGQIVETTPGGDQVATRLLDTSGKPPGAGALFGLAVTPAGRGVYFVDDATNFLRLLH